MAKNKDILELSIKITGHIFKEYRQCVGTCGRQEIKWVQDSVLLKMTGRPRAVRESHSWFRRAIAWVRAEEVAALAGGVRESQACTFVSPEVMGPEGLSPGPISHCWTPPRFCTHTHSIPVCDPMVPFPLATAGCQPEANSMLSSSSWHLAHESAVFSI